MKTLNEQESWNSKTKWLLSVSVLNLFFFLLVVVSFEYQTLVPVQKLWSAILDENEPAGFWIFETLQVVHLITLLRYRSVYKGALLILLIADVL